MREKFSFKEIHNIRNRRIDQNLLQLDLRDHTLGYVHILISKRTLFLCLESRKFLGLLGALVSSTRANENSVVIVELLRSPYKLLYRRVVLVSWFDGKENFIQFCTKNVYRNKRYSTTETLCTIV